MTDIEAENLRMKLLVRPMTDAGWRWTRETFMSKITIGNVIVIKEEDDPICPRISMGGDEEHGYYIIYRGEITEIQRIYEELSKTIKLLE